MRRGSLAELGSDPALTGVPGVLVTGATTAAGVAGGTVSGTPVHVVGLLGGRPVGDEAAAALAAARLVAGGPDQLAAVADLLAPGAGTMTVAAGLAALDDVARHPGPVVVLASGDPGLHGIARALAARLGPERLVVHPAPSSVALAFARLGLAWDGAVVASCHTGDAAAAAAASGPGAGGRGAVRPGGPARGRRGRPWWRSVPTTRPWRWRPGWARAARPLPGSTRRRPWRPGSSTTGPWSCWPIRTPVGRARPAAGR